MNLREAAGSLARAVVLPAAAALVAGVASGGEPIRLGIIGLDTSHAPAFTKILNDPQAPDDVAGCRVVIATPQGSPDIPASVSRLEKFTAEVRGLGVEIVPTIDAVVAGCDAVLLESVDGRPHLEQVLPVLRAGKPVFVDKPLAASLADAIAIVETARKRRVPMFSSSALRFSDGIHALRDETITEIGRVRRVELTGPCSHEPTHPDLFWYGIHGVEGLFTILGPGCTGVRRTQATAETDEVVGSWPDGRSGTFRGAVSGKAPFAGVASGENGDRDTGEFAGYRPLVVEIVKFFRTRRPPVDADETLEIIAFMEAADESRRRGGAEVSIADTLAAGRKAAAARLAALGE
jgi:hypothetical protein